MVNKAVIINNYETFKALGEITLGKGEVILTENPLVFKILGDLSFKIKTLDSYLAADEKKVIGAFSSDLCTSWVSAINKHYANYGIPLGQTLSNSLYYLATTVFYRAIQLKRSLKEFGVLEIPYLRQTGKHFFDQKHLPFSSDDNFFFLLTNYSPFKEKISLHPLDRENDDSKNSSGKNYEVIRNFKWYYAIQYLLGISAFRTKLASRVFEKIIPREGKSAKFFGFGKINFLIHQPNDLIIWKTLSLLFKGRFLRLQDTGLPHVEITHFPGDKVLIDALRRLFHPSSFSILDGEEFEGVVAFLAHHACNYISTYLLPAHRLLEPKIRSLCERGKLQGNTYFFSGGLTEPAQSLISLIYSSCGVPTIGFQEGGSCLLKLYRDLMHHTHISRGDAFVSYHENEEIYFKKRTGCSERPFFIMGTQKLLRAPLPWVSSFFGRIIWKIPFRQRAILYLTGKLQEEVILPAYQASGIEYWKLQQHLVSGVFPKVDGKVFIKLRQKGLITTDNRNVHPLQLLDLPANVKMRSSPDFRYIRHAVDLFIIDIASSGLGWALATDKPIVYLHYEKTPLEDEVRELLKEAVFLVEIREGDDSWGEELLSVLNRDKKTLLEDWKAKKDKRALFTEKFIWGRPTKRKDFIRWLATLKNKPSTLLTESLRGPERAVAIQ